MPAELDEILRRIMQLEIEREALKKEKDAASKDRLKQDRTRTGGPDPRARRRSFSDFSQRSASVFRSSGLISRCGRSSKPAAR